MLTREPAAALFAGVWTSLLGGCEVSRSSSISCCPEGWGPGTHEQGYCSPPVEYASEVRDRLGTGAFGSVAYVTGVCGLCDPCDCQCNLAQGNLLRAYAVESGLGQNKPGDVCPWRPAPDDPVETVATDAGRYEMPLPAGEYLVIAEDPVDGCPVAWRIELDEGSVVQVGFHWDFGAY